MEEPPRIHRAVASSVEILDEVFFFIKLWIANPAFPVRTNAGSFWREAEQKACPGWHAFWSTRMGIGKCYTSPCQLVHVWGRDVEGAPDSHMAY